VCLINIKEEISKKAEIAQMRNCKKQKLRKSKNCKKVEIAQRRKKYKGEWHGW